MTVGREAPGGEAIGILNLDNKPSEAAVNEVSENPAITSVKVIELPASGHLPSWLSSGAA
jgi:D-3-phosphoglycerate dehydrogenase